jgi:hypothetical protein
LEVVIFYSSLQFLIHWNKTRVTLFCMFILYLWKCSSVNSFCKRYSSEKWPSAIPDHEWIVMPPIFKETTPVVPVIATLLPLFFSWSLIFLRHTLIKKYPFLDFFIFIHFHYIAYNPFCRDGIYFDKILVSEYKQFIARQWEICRRDTHQKNGHLLYQTMIG